MLRVLFKDNTLWEKGNSQLETVTLHKIEDEKLLDFMKNRVGADAKYLAVEMAEKWICICGRLNYIKALTCQRCSRDQVTTIENYSKKEKISEMHAVYEAEQAKETQRLTEERAKQTAIRKRRLRKTFILITALISFVSLIVTALFGYRTNYTFSMENYNLLQNKDDSLIQMIKADNHDKVNFLINNGANVDYVNEEGNRPITEAIKNGNKEIIKSLINKGSSLKNLNSKGDSALHLAVLYDKDNILEYLLNITEDINQKNDHGHTIVYTAIDSNRPDALKKILDNKNIDLNDLDEQGNNILQVLSDAGDIDFRIIKKLSHENIDILKPNNRGETILSNLLGDGDFSTLYKFMENNLISREQINSIKSQDNVTNTDNYYKSVISVIENEIIKSDAFNIDDIGPWEVILEGDTLLVFSNDLPNRTLEQLNELNASGNKELMRDYGERVQEIVSLATLLLAAEEKLNWDVSIDINCTSFYPSSIPEDILLNFTGSCGYGFPILKMGSNSDKIKVFEEIYNW